MTHTNKLVVGRNEIRLDVEPGMYDSIDIMATCGVILIAAIQGSPGCFPPKEDDLDPKKFCASFSVPLHCSMEMCQGIPVTLTVESLDAGEISITFHPTGVH